MSKNNHQANTRESLSELQEAVELLAQEVRVLREVIDEIREDFRWAVQNGCLTAGDETVPESHAGNFLKSARSQADFGEDMTTTEDVDQQCDSPAEHSTEEPAGSAITGDLNERIQQHEEWERTVRDPAKEASEGVRKLQTKDQGASAEYEIALLPSGRWALRTDLRYHVGDLRGNTTPWAEYESREECVDQFVSRAKQFFDREIDAGGNELQQKARTEMLRYFEGSLFGFVEPDVVRQHDTAAQQPEASTPDPVTVPDMPEQVPLEQAAVPIQTEPTLSSNADSADVSLRDSHGKGVESHTDNHRPYTLDDFKVFLQRIDTADINASALQANFARLVSGREQLLTQLISEKNAQELKKLASRFGCFDAGRNTKQQNAEAIIRSMMQAYTLQKTVMYQPFSGETYETAIQKAVESIGEEEIQSYLQDRTARSDKIEKSLTRPETLEEFRYFVNHKGETELRPEQRVAFDRLQAKQTRAERANRKTATVEQFSGDVADLQITIKEGFHTRQNIPLWICQLSERVDRATFSDLKFKAQQLGGWWSSFKKADAGFQFKNEDSAQKFQSLLQGNADRSDELADRKTRKIETASERLLQLTSDLEQSANAALHQDRLTNTVRRSEMAAGIRGRAYAELAFAGTMRRLATGLAAGETLYLDGIRTKTQLSTLINVLRRAKRKRNELLLREKGDLGVWERHNTVEELDQRPLEVEDADFAEFPYPNIYKRNLEAVITSAANRKGLKQRAEKLKKRTAAAGEFIAFQKEYEINEFTEFCNRCKGAGIDVQWLERSLDDFKRLHAANIQTLPELRMALRELIPHLQKKQADDPVLKAEQALIGKKLEGFFPTPRSVISRMLELADIPPEARILEPSAGKGDILDMLREHCPDARLTAIELNGTLFDVLAAKGHSVERGNFLEHQGEYDRIVMNPPFEKGADMEHVRHAFDLLAPNGKLVAIMSEGPFFRNDTQATEFRNWLDEVGGDSEQLSEDAFNSSEAFRKTGVRTRIVTIAR
ncbi:DNA methyltransferase family protein [Gimesia fumaroli]|uniref:Uncharacterized protein n=1 Tax=Gimesia fumaroli TaxID=2527976 RepID=A0A518I5Z3_9PLAN|nr:methyltransferase [Gimesia fumaroli]QDV48479.1 hypothetical protein Enr17x_04910 [Gimesia fumaroli]